MTTNREIREMARQAVCSFLQANLETMDGDLFVDVEEAGLSEAGEAVFIDEVRKIMKRVWP